MSSVAPTSSLTKTRKDEASIDEYAQDVQIIWPVDKTRPVLLQWLLVVAHASALAEEVRKSAWDKVVHEVAEVFVWWLSFILRISDPPDYDTDPDAVFYLPCAPSDIIWSKFPNLCPVCFGYGLDEQRQGALANKEDFSLIQEFEEEELLVVYDSVHLVACNCLTRKKFVETRTSAFKKFTKDHLAKLSTIQRVSAGKPPSLKALEETLQKVFEPPIYALTAEEVAFHLLEEIGEVSEALANLMLQPTGNGADFLEEHKRRLRNLREELADVFSWIITMREKAHLILKRAADYTKYSASKHSQDEIWQSVSRIVEKILNDTSNMPALVWVTYGHGNELTCEKCGQRPCDQQSDVHKQDSGHLWGEHLRPYFAQISSLNACGLLDVLPFVPEVPTEQVDKTRKVSKKGSKARSRKNESDRRRYKPRRAKT